MGKVTITARALRPILVGIVALVVLSLWFALSRQHPSGPVAPAPSSTHGFDVSWPQCAGSSTGRMPTGRPSYLLLGLTHGAGGTVNPCLGAQLDWARSRGV